MAAGQDSIRERAYHIWEQAGRPEGRDVEFWTRAEAEIAASAAVPAARDITARKPRVAKAAEKPAAKAEAKPRKQPAKQSTTRRRKANGQPVEIEA